MTPHPSSFDNRDHQQFEKTVLNNGITVYIYTDHFPINCVEIILPVGSAHAIVENNFLPGAPHLLEHTQLIRSQTYPDAYQLDRLLGLQAGHSNAATHAKSTNHWIDTPVAKQEFAISSLVDRVFYPTFNNEDLAIERGVIINERNQKKFYPGKSKASHYYYTQFLNDTFFPLEQIFGSDADLNQATIGFLETMHHQVSRSNEVIALAVGNSSFESLKEKLAALETASCSFQTQITPTTWANKDYHLSYFDTVAQPLLEIAWIHPSLEYKEFRSLCFIIGLLINTTQGPLYKEFREEKGWTYGIDGTCVRRECNTVCGLSFPLNSLDQVEYVRDGLSERIFKALQNQGLIEDEIERQLGNQVYAYQTAGSIISGASTDLINGGSIHSEAELEETMQAMKDPFWRDYLRQHYFKPEEMGAVCFMPERRKTNY